MTTPQAAGINLTIEEDLSQVAAAAAERFVQLAQQKTAGDSFRVALSGGSTPKALYCLLASDEYRDRVEWDKIEFFLGDERWVPPSDRESNYRLAREELFSKVPVDPKKIHPVPYNGHTPWQAAMAYEETIRKVFDLKEGELPRFDLIFLGLGDDAHTASLFPHTEALREEERLVTANFVEKLNSYRITLTPPVLRAAQEIIIMVTGEGKAEALQEVLQGRENIEQYPAQIVRQVEGTVNCFSDEAAASNLSGA